MWKWKWKISWSCVKLCEYHKHVVKATLFRELRQLPRFAAASSTVGRTCVNNEQNSKGPGSRPVSTQRERCVKTNEMSQTEMCFELSQSYLMLSQFCHNFSERKMEGFKIMVLQWWLIDWLGSLDSLGSVRGSTLSTLLWFYASVIISNVYLVCNSAAWYLWCIAPDSLKCLGIPNSFPMHLRSYLELGWFKSFFCLANFTNHFDITTLEMEYRGGGDVRNF